MAAALLAALTGPRVLLLLLAGLLLPALLLLLAGLLRLPALLLATLAALLVLLLVGILILILAHHALQVKRSLPRTNDNVCRLTFVPLRSLGNRTELNRQVRIPVAQNAAEECIMGRYLLLWLLGIPLPILVLIWIFGGLH